MGIMTQVLKPIELGVLTIIMLIGIVALATELAEYEEVAKVVVIPSLILLILVAGYGMFKSVYLSR
jgi:predicted Na+-dependent transporter